MTRYVLDTDTFSLYLAGHPVVVQRVLSVPREEVAITAVTVMELAQGWLAQVNRHSAKGCPVLWRAYDRLCELPRRLARLTVLSYGAAEEARFVEWRRAGIRIGTNDLRIAAVAACAGAVTVTRNGADFGRVTGISTEDWSA